MPTNRLTNVRMARDAAGLSTLDLTRSNPTAVGLSYPTTELAALLGGTAKTSHHPDPRGLRSAREAIATELSMRGPQVSPDDLILTASTSEAYSFLFKLLCDPGDSILIPVPSYPLLEHLATLEAVEIGTFPFSLHSSSGRSRWALEAHVLQDAIERSAPKAIVAIHPNNPTGNFLTDDELRLLEAACARRDIPLISDEVFFDYPTVETVARSAASLENALSFSLGGLSKSSGLPHWKLGWIQVSGPARMRTDALAGLELIADTFLSVSSLVQAALPALLPIAREIRGSISIRIHENLRELQQRVANVSSIELLPVQGGWSAVLRLPRLMTDEELALELLEKKGVAVQPGYFYDFQQDGFVVLSLLCHPGEFAEGVAGIVSLVEELCGPAREERG